METVFARDLARVRPNPWVRAATPLPLCMALALAALSPKLLVLLPHALLGTLLAASYVFRRNPLARVERATVRVTESEIAIGEERLARRDLRGGLLTYDGDGRAVARLFRRRLRPPADVVVPDAAEGRALLAALGFDALQAVATFRVSSRVSRYPMLFTAASFALWVVALAASQRSALAALPSLAAAVATAVFAVLPARVDVGTDGLLVSWAWTRRFVPASSIVRADTYEHGDRGEEVTGVELALRDDGRMQIPVAAKKWDGGRARMLAERIRAVVKAEQAGARGLEPAMLARGGADVRTWVERLRRLGAGANATLRTAPVDPEALWRILTDARNEPEVRAAAAVALAPTLDESGRARLAGAARATAEPRLRGNPSANDVARLLLVVPAAWHAWRFGGDEHGGRRVEERGGDREAASLGRG